MVIIPLCVCVCCVLNKKIKTSLNPNPFVRDWGKCRLVSKLSTMQIQLWLFADVLLRKQTIRLFSNKTRHSKEVLSSGRSVCMCLYVCVCVCICMLAACACVCACVHACVLAYEWPGLDDSNRTGLLCLASRPDHFPFLLDWIINQGWRPTAPWVG